MKEEGALEGRSIRQRERGGEETETLLLSLHIGERQTGGSEGEQRWTERPAEKLERRRGERGFYFETL